MTAGALDRLSSWLYERRWALLYILVFFLWTLVARRLYSLPFTSAPTRLNVTLAAWSKLSFSQHWLLFFLTEQDVGKGIPYSNMPLFYSWFYATYHLALNFLTASRWPNSTTYLASMATLCLASWNVIGRHIERLKPLSALCAALVAPGIITTSPFIAGYLSTTNHDTVFPFIAAASTVLAFRIVRGDQTQSVTTWLALFLCASAGLIGFIILVLCCFERERLGVSYKLWCLLFAICIFSVVYPILIAKLVFKQSSASDFLFRSGFDGSTQYFKTHFQALTDPLAHYRSLLDLLGMKLFALASMLVFSAITFRRTYWRELYALLLAIMIYISQLVVFPQAVSIHPYLYDLLLVIPIDTTIALAFCLILGSFQSITKGASVLVFFSISTLLVHSNLVRLAQGHFTP